MGRKSRGPTELPRRSDRKSRSRSPILWACIVLAVPVVSFGAWVFADWWSCLPDEVPATFVGRDACADCHAAETQQWIGSDHDLAMDSATEETVLGDFDNATFSLHGITSRMFRDGDSYMIHTEGPDGEMADFQVRYVLGVRPLQQYMVEFDRPADMPAREIARLQVLRISWDTVKNEWINVPPPDVSDKLAPDDDLHWTRIAQCWNNMCAYCHSTNLQKSYDVATMTYHTTFSEIDVSCEACHGPGSLHVQLANADSWFWDRKRGYGLARLKTRDTRAEIETCAPCHSRRCVHYPNFRPGDHYYDYFNNGLLDEATYYADGQIMDEDYVFGSFIQSKMYHQDIRCSDCHNPHSGRLKQDGNKVCTSCHQRQHPAAKYDTPAHHFHKSDSTGAACAECHMPETTYMEVDPRRDHSIRNPRPDLSVALGTPNACTRCHLTDADIPAEKRRKLRQYRDWIDAARGGDQEIKSELERLDKWMLESMQKWYKKKTWDESFAMALEAGRTRRPNAEDLLDKVARDRRLPGIVRATAIHQRGQLMSVRHFQTEIAALDDADPQVRAAAVSRFYGQIPNVGSSPLSRGQQQQIGDTVAPTVRHLVPLLDDPRRVVRAEAGRVLAQLPSSVASTLLNGRQREKLDQAIQEYAAGVLESNDRGGAHMELGVLYESMGRERMTEDAYRTALRLEPLLTGPRSNLAALLDRRAEREARRSSAGQITGHMRRDQEESQQLRREELELLARDARLVPDNASIQYRYGLSLYLQGEQQKAEEALRAACRLESDNDRFLYALVLFFDKYQRYDEALAGVDRLLTLRPGDSEYLQLRDMIRGKVKR